MTGYDERVDPSARGRAARRSVCAPILVGAALLAPMAAQAAPPGPPPPQGTNGHKVGLVAAGIPSPTQIAFAYGRILVASLGDEQTGKGGGVYAVWRGQTKLIDKMPTAGLIYRGGTLYGSSGHSIVAWSGWRRGAFTHRKVIFQGPKKQIAFLETMAFAPSGRIFVGSSDAGEKGPIGAPLTGHILSIRRDGSDLQDTAKGLRQPFGIAFRRGDGSPWVGNESDESKPTPPDFLVHAVRGSDFGFPACQWLDPAAAACVGKTTPSVFLPQHASPTGLVALGTTIYAAFFGGTTKAGPEIRALAANGSSTQVVRSAVPLIGIGLSGRWLYFGDVTGTIYRIKI